MIHVSGLSECHLNDIEVIPVDSEMYSTHLPSTHPPRTNSGLARGAEELFVVKGERLREASLTRIGSEDGVETRNIEDALLVHC